MLDIFPCCTVKCHFCCVVCSFSRSCPIDVTLATVGADTSRARLKELAVSGAHFLRDHVKLPDGTFAFALSKEGKPVVLQRKIYSACFYIMGLAVCECGFIWHLTFRA